MKIALALICKGSKEEAEFLDQCLENCAQYFDGIFVTSTYKEGEEPNTEVSDVCRKYRAVESHFQWKNDFAEARNFNFAQVPKDFDYICWCDADDIWQNGDQIRKLVADNPTVDAWLFWYYYEHDQWKNPTVVHKKTQIVRNDGCVTWIGKLHENFAENRSLTVKFDPNIIRVHKTTPEHVEEARHRNIRISKDDVRARPNDPTSYWNLANSYWGAGKAWYAKRYYLQFLKQSGSDDEKYLAYQRLAAVELSLGDKQKAEEYMRIAIGMFPELPDAYNNLGNLYFQMGLFDKAEKYYLIGLVTKPQYHKMIVYNPRDYDYNPMMALAKVYFNKSRPDLALPLLKGCLKIYPYDTHLRTLVADMEKENERLGRVIETVKNIETMGDDKEKVMAAVNSLPKDLQSHPAICRIRNRFDVKTTSSGRDIAYYCGDTVHEWNPELFKTKGFGGSEEAVINLSKEWAKAGYNVTVFNSCGLEPMTVDGVTYKPWWHFNGKDRYDHLIFWRHPKLLDYELNSDRIYVDLHDVVPFGEFTEARLAKITKVMVKTKAHAALFPNIPEEKLAIVPNGIDFGLFDQEKPKKNRYLMVNTSSPDRCMDVLPELFAKVKKQVPRARLIWAYGWDNYEKWYRDNDQRMQWMHKIQREMEESGIEDAGRLPQKECARLYMEAGIFAYPSEFYEIDCISVKKAQAAGCIPITTDFAALGESAAYGTKVHSHKTIKNWAQPYQIGFGLDNRNAKAEWVKAAVRTIKEWNLIDTKEMEDWSRQFSWDLIANRWINLFESPSSGKASAVATATGTTV